LNTAFVALKFEEINKDKSFFKQFGLATVFDYFVYEIIILVTKSLIYFFLIKDENLSWWKKFLISIISAMPWVFIFLLIIKILISNNIGFLNVRLISLVCKHI
jgi:hypothetical protein